MARPDPALTLPHRLYRSSGQWRLAGVLLVGMGVMFGALGTAILISQRDLVALSVVLFGLPWVAAGAAVWWWDHRHAIEVGPDGIRWHGTSSTETAWEDIVGYRYGASELLAAGLAAVAVAGLERSGAVSGRLGSKVALTLRFRDGRTGRIDQRTHDGEALAGRIITLLQGPLLLAARTKLVETGAVAFGTAKGPLVVTREGLNPPGVGVVPYPEIGAVKLLRGQLDVGGRFGVPFREVDDLFVLLALVAEVRGRPRDAD